MSRDTKPIIGTIISVGVMVAGLLLTQIAGVNTRLDHVRDDMRALRTSIERLDTRLDAVEVAVGKLDRRLLTIERQLLPSLSSKE